MIRCKLVLWNGGGGAIGFLFDGVVLGRHGRCGIGLLAAGLD